MSGTPPRVVVTGGIGSGKSLVCSLLGALGTAVIDADSLGHAVLWPDGEAFAQVTARWPQAVSGGRIDRSALGRIVFSDPGQLAELMEMTHPHIRARLFREVDRYPDRPVAVEISAPSDLVMPDWPVLVVDADPGTVRTRLRERGMSDGDIRRRLDSQRSRQEWLELADLVISNRLDRDALAEEVKRAARELGVLSH
ncbi:MAG: dephospho-CoA kinase [bacterium]|nr:dephospho-CoA kinase [bacterium]